MSFTPSIGPVVDTSGPRPEKLLISWACCCRLGDSATRRLGDSAIRRFGDSRHRSDRQTQSLNPMIVAVENVNPVS